MNLGNIGNLGPGIKGIVKAAKGGNVDSIINASLSVAKQLFGGAKG